MYVSEYKMIEAPQGWHIDGVSICARPRRRGLVSNALRRGTVTVLLALTFTLEGYL